MRLITKSTTTISGLLVIGAAVTLAKYTYDPWQISRRTSDDPKEQVITAQTISSPEELAQVLGHDATILHLDVDWAIQAIQSRPVVVEFKQSLARDTRYRDIVFRRIDCSIQEGPVWDAVGDWLRSQDADTGLMHAGYGAILWIKSGNLVDSVHSASLEGVDSLVAKTRVAMSKGAGP